MIKVTVELVCVLFFTAGAYAPSESLALPPEKAIFAVFVVPSVSRIRGNKVNGVRVWNELPWCAGVSPRRIRASSHTLITVT